MRVYTALRSETAVSRSHVSSYRTQGWLLFGSLDCTYSSLQSGAG